MMLNSEWICDNKSLLLEGCRRKQRSLVADKCPSLKVLDVERTHNIAPCALLDEERTHNLAPCA
jgi:hypothetical protein